MNQKSKFKSTIRACYLGYITQAIVNNFAPLIFVIFQDTFEISLSLIGNLILINFGTQLITDFIAVKYVDRIGYRRSIIIAHALSAAGLILLGILPNVLPNPYIGLVIAVIFYAVGGGLIEVLISPIIDSLPGEEKASTMSLLHSFYCWGQVLVVIISTVVLRIVGNNSWIILTFVWSIVPILNAVNFLRVPFMPPVAEEDRVSIKQLFSSKTFIIAVVLMMCAGSSELSMSQWSSLFAERGLGVPKILGDILGPALFAVFMGIGRTIYGFWGEKIHLKKALTFCAAFSVLCYMITVFAPLPILSLIGCALCGFGVSLMWPGVISFTSMQYPGGGTAMFGILALAGDIGCSIGPWLTGLISDIVSKLNLNTGVSSEQFGLKVGMLIASLFPLVMILGVRMLGNSSKSKGKAA